ncbi:MAG TPA: twin-arginine translocase TatA/TatE family subunit [Armatimonadota bacterium]|nr:twin-arginine translocase TatA/TatE family subunit [Armatimonadota bacterium]
MVHIPSMTGIIIVALLFILLFGAQKLPEAARSIGRASTEFKKGLREGTEPDHDHDQPALKE